MSLIFNKDIETVLKDFNFEFSLNDLQKDISLDDFLLLKENKELDAQIKEEFKDFLGENDNV